MHQSKVIAYPAMVLVAIGLVMLLLAGNALRKNLSPYPSPRSNAKLIQTGIYKYLRHPIYTAILFATLGWALYSNSTFRFIIFVAIMILFEFKSRYEEQLLIQKFPNYLIYKTHTGKYFPKI
jgi:protein-S-isoprenylcysteine O-methyltransferase Ste14